jgi:hypothetical protein
MNLTQLRSELQGDPASIGYASHVASGADFTLAAMLNAPRTNGRKKDAFLTERGILFVLGPSAGDTFLSAIEAASQANSLLARTVRILRDLAGQGIDVGDPATQAQLDALALAGVITAESSAAVKAYGTRQWSRAEIVLGEGVHVSDSDVARALRGAI